MGTSSHKTRWIVLICIAAVTLLLCWRGWSGFHRERPKFVETVVVENPQIVYSHSARKNATKKSARSSTGSAKAVGTSEWADGGVNSDHTDDDDETMTPPHQCLHHNPEFVKRAYAAVEEASVLDARPRERQVFTTTTSTGAPGKSSRNNKNNNNNTRDGQELPHFVAPTPNRFRPLRVRVDVSNLFHTDSICSGVDDVQADFLGDKVRCGSDDILTSSKRQYIMHVVLPEIVARVERLFEAAVVSPATADAFAHSAEGSTPRPKSPAENAESVATAPPFPMGASNAAHTRLVVPKKACGRDGIYIPPEHTTTGVEDADLVIYALAAPVRDAAGSSSSNGGGGGSAGPTTLAWSSYCAVDVYGRPTVAHLNFVPAAIQPSRTATLRRQNLPADVASSSDNSAQGVMSPFAGSFAGVTAPSSATSSNGRFSVCPVQLSSTAGATPTSSTVLPAALDGDGDQWWTAKYIRIIMHEMFHVLGFAPPLLSEYAVKSQHRGQEVSMISEAAPVRAARAFFQCPALDGVELEDEGGDGTAMGHWERLWLRDDIMSGVPSSASAVSAITLAFLGSLPFYRVHGDYAEPMPWGAAAGCGFLESRCKPLTGAAGVARLARSEYTESSDADEVYGPSVVVDGLPPSTSPRSSTARRSSRRAKAVGEVENQTVIYEELPTVNHTTTTSTTTTASTTSTTAAASSTTTTHAPTTTTTTVSPSTSTSTTTTTTTHAPTTTTTTSPSTTTTSTPSTTEAPSTTSTTSTSTTTTTTTSKAPVVPQPNTTTSTSTTSTTTTTTKAPTTTSTTTSTTTTTTSPPAPAKREDLLARAKYWCTDKGLTSHRVPQCTYDRKSIGICNVDFKPIKNGGLGTNGDGAATPTPTSAPPLVQDGETDDDDGSGDASHSQAEENTGSSDSGSGTGSDGQGKKPKKQKGPSATGRSLLMNGCPVVEPFLNRWCTNGLLSVELAPDAEQDVLTQKQGYYFGPQSRCARVDDFKHVGTTGSARAGASTEGESEGQANNTLSSENASDASQFNKTKKSKRGAKAGGSNDDADTVYVSAVRSAEDVVEMTDARCLRMRCVAQEMNLSSEPSTVNTGVTASAYHRLEIQIGGIWLACPEDGRSGYIDVPRETGFSGTLACEEAELLCTAELIYEANALSEENEKAMTGAAAVAGLDSQLFSSASSSSSSAASWLPEYAVPIQLLLTVAPPETVPRRPASVAKASASPKDEEKTKKEKNKKHKKSSKDKKKKSDKKGTVPKPMNSIMAALSDDADMSMSSDVALLMLSAWRLTVELCPGALEVAVHNDLDALLAMTPKDSAFSVSPLGTFVKQREGAARILTPFTMSLWSGRSLAQIHPGSSILGNSTSSTSAAQRGRTSSSSSKGKDDDKKKKNSKAKRAAAEDAETLATRAWLQSYTGSDAMPPILLQLGFHLSLTTGDPSTLAHYTHALSSLTWRANSSLPSVAALLTSSFYTLRDGGRRHLRCGENWEVPLPGAFGEQLATPQTARSTGVGMQLWTDAVFAPPPPTTSGGHVVPLDGPMLPPGNLFAIAQVELQLAALVPPNRARASMLSHPLVLQALRRDVSALLGITSNLISIQDVVWAPQVNQRQRTRGVIDEMADPRVLLHMLRSFFKKTGSGTSGTTTLTAGKGTLGTVTAVVYAHPLPETLTFSYLGNTSTTVGARGEQMHVRSGSVRRSEEMQRYTRQYWQDVLQTAQQERLPLHATSEALQELLFGVAPTGASFVFISAPDSKSRAAGGGKLSDEDASTLSAYDQLQMFREQALSQRTTAATSAADKKLKALRSEPVNGDVWIGAVVAVRDGAPSTLPATCHASMADSLLDRTSTISVWSLLTPSFLRKTQSCRRWRVHGGMSWCFSVYEGTTCAEANTIDDAVRSFCVNIQTVWAILTAVSTLVVLWWVYGLARCCCRCCCASSSYDDLDDFDR